MVKVDLITGFLGSGKTTFIREYVKYLTEVAGEKVCILENDYGAINVDTMLLADLKSDKCALKWWPAVQITTAILEDSGLS